MAFPHQHLCVLIYYVNLTREWGDLLLAPLDTCELILPAFFQAALDCHGDVIRLNDVGQGAADGGFAEAVVVCEIDVSLGDDRRAGVSSWLGACCRS